MNRLRRPTKLMMRAVNASIEGQEAEVERLVEGHSLDRGELAARLELRQGRPYDLAMGKGRRVQARPSRVQARPKALIPEIGDDLGVATLIRLEGRVRKALDRKPPEEVARAREAFTAVEEQRRRLEAAEKALKALE